MSSARMPEKILLVDDEALMLRVFERLLRRQFDVQTAGSGAEGLEKIKTSGPFAVIVSDLKMPDMNGIEFLEHARALAPNAVRMVITAFAEASTAIELVNRGNVFRFLTKPCDPKALVGAIECGIEHHRMMSAEREVSETTLRNGVKVLTELLMVVNPKAFRRVDRVARCVRHVTSRLGVVDPWIFEMAATLHEMGPAFLPDDAMEKLHSGWPIPPSQSEILTACLDFERRLSVQADPAAVLAELRKAEDGFPKPIIDALESFADTLPPPRAPGDASEVPAPR